MLMEIEYTYNLVGDRVYFRTTGGATQELIYDAWGNITGVIDGNQNHTHYALDDWGRITGITKPDGSTESYLYNHSGNITSATDGEGNTTLYTYDLSENMVCITDPTGEKEQYVYDKEGHVIEKTDRNNITTQFAFTMYGAPLYRRVKNGALEESYQYTPEGLMKAAISSGMHYNYEYDIMGRIAKKSASGRTLLSYHYDLNGNLTSQKDVTGKVTEYTYNALDLIEKVTDNGIIVGEYSYYPDGTTKSLKNGTLYTEYTFDTDKNLTSLKTRLGTEVLTDNHYTYDRNGNRTEKRQIHGNTHYTYDALNQLTKVQYPTYTEELYYDKAGNRTKRITKGIEELYKYDPRNRLTEYIKGGVKTNFIYDNAGNLLRDDKAKYTYDAFNRTEKVETFDGHVQINRYDAEGLRYEMEEDKRLVQFIFRGDEIVGEEKDNKVIRYIRGYDLIASDAESARTYYHYASDEMGSITHVVEENQIRNHYEYDVWGNTTTCEETIENRFRFNGQQYDPITQQYYLRARFYNPVIGRFTQEDTYRGDGLNLYVYCANNPVYYVDPSGNNSDCIEKKAKPYLDQNMPAEEAYRKAYAEDAQEKLDKGGLTAKEKYEYEQRLKRITNRIPTPPNGLTTEKFYNEQYKRRMSQVPNTGARGKWTGTRGESVFIPSDVEIKKILEKYGLKGIKYRNGVPDFSDLARYTVTVQGMRGGRKPKDPRPYNFSIAFGELSMQTGVSKKALRKMVKDNDYTWHECNDMKTMIMVPSKINLYFGHMGGVGEINLLTDIKQGKVK